MAGPTGHCRRKCAIGSTPTSQGLPTLRGIQRSGRLGDDGVRVAGVRPGDDDDPGRGVLTAQEPGELGQGRIIRADRLDSSPVTS